MRGKGNDPPSGHDTRNHKTRSAFHEKARREIDDMVTQTKGLFFFLLSFLGWSLKEGRPQGSKSSHDNETQNQYQRMHSLEHH